jgi:hypothetical protein
MNKHGESRRLRIVISDEETGEEVTIVAGVETLFLLVAPDTLGGRGYRRILMGDAELSAELLLDVLQEMTWRVRHGTIMDIGDVLDDNMLLELTEGLPLQ